MTAELTTIRRSVEQRFDRQFTTGDLFDLGQWNRRRIAGTSIWSQHAWGNAWDIGVRDPIIGDLVADYLKRNRRKLGVGTILWRVRNHYDHIHVEALPKRRGVPPLSATKPTELEDDMALTKMIQDVLAAEGYLGADGKPLKRDGIVGRNTRHAFDSMVQDARDGANRVLDDDQLDQVAAKVMSRIAERLT